MGRCENKISKAERRMDIEMLNSHISLSISKKTMSQPAVRDLNKCGVGVNSL